MNFFSKLRNRLRGNRNHLKNRRDSNSDVLLVEKNTGYAFRDPALLDLALTHPSYNLKDAAKPNNQRLEFLGDSILGAVLSNELYRIYPEENEGSLSRKKAYFAQGAFLAELGLSIGLNKVIKMSPAELKNKGNLRPSTLEDAVEALVGAIYLDGGFRHAEHCIIRWIGDLQQKLEERTAMMNPKGKLQELIQAQDTKKKIRYKLLQDNGPDHQKTFIVSVIIGEETIAKGQGKSKKEAESEAAEKALIILSKE
jgi:ribonuclease-3